MASLLPKRTIANPATAEEIATTKRSTAIGYKALEYGSYAIGGLGVVKGISLLHKAGSFTRGKIKRSLLRGVTSPITFLKGRFNKPTGIRRDKRLYKDIPFNEKTYKKYIDPRKYGGRWDTKRNRWVNPGETFEDKLLAKQGVTHSGHPSTQNYNSYMNMLSETKTSVPTGIRVHRKFKGVYSDKTPPLKKLLYLDNSAITVRRIIPSTFSSSKEINKAWQLNKPMGLLGRKK